MAQSSNDMNKVIRELKKLYFDQLLPIEKQCLFHKFSHSPILESEMNSKPTILLIGQYSTGKTTFIRNLIGLDYPEMHIGPEPTTDKFTAIVYGSDEQVIKGNALTGKQVVNIYICAVVVLYLSTYSFIYMQNTHINYILMNSILILIFIPVYIHVHTSGVTDLPFSGLSTFGSGFLNKFCAAISSAPLLKQVNIIDTPGVLSGEKQRTSRGYDFAKVSKWFAERSGKNIHLFSIYV